MSTGCSTTTTASGVVSDCVRRRSFGGLGATVTATQYGLRRSYFVLEVVSPLVTEVADFSLVIGEYPLHAGNYSPGGAFDSGYDNGFNIG